MVLSKRLEYIQFLSWKYYYGVLLCMISKLSVHLRYNNNYLCDFLIVSYAMKPLLFKGKDLKSRRPLGYEEK